MTGPGLAEALAVVFFVVFCFLSAYQGPRPLREPGLVLVQGKTVSISLHRDSLVIQTKIFLTLFTSQDHIPDANKQHRRKKISRLTKVNRPRFTAKNASTGEIYQAKARRRLFDSQHPKAERQFRILENEMWVTAERRGMAAEDYQSRLIESVMRERSRIEEEQRTQISGALAELSSVALKLELARGGPSRKVSAPAGRGKSPSRAKPASATKVGSPVLPKASAGTNTVVSMVELHPSPAKFGSERRNLPRDK